LGALEDGLAGSRIKEEIWVVRGVLSLNETIELGIFGCFLAEYGVSQGRGILCKILL
jgi:hypothetical protein